MGERPGACCVRIRAGSTLHPCPPSARRAISCSCAHGSCWLSRSTSSAWKLQGIHSQLPTVYDSAIRYAERSVSENGVLAYRSGSNLNRELVWCDRRGKPLSRVSAPGEYKHLELSPDGTQVALERNDPQTETADIWL